MKVYVIVIMIIVLMNDNKTVVRFLAFLHTAANWSL